MSLVTKGYVLTTVNLYTSDRSGFQSSASAITSQPAGYSSKKHRLSERTFAVRVSCGMWRQFLHTSQAQASTSPKPQLTIGAHGPDVSGAELGAVWGHVGCQVSKLRSPKVVLQTTNSSLEPLKLRIQAGFKGVLLVCICSRKLQQH